MNEDELKNLETYLNNDYKLKNKDPMRPENIRTELFGEVLNFLGVSDCVDNSIRIDVNPINQKATVTIIPDDMFNIQAIAQQTKQQTTFDVKLNLRF